MESKTLGQGHKKIRGQGQEQPFQGQTLLRPRDRNARGQGPRTQRGSNLKKKKQKKVFATKIRKFSDKKFRRSPKKKKILALKIQAFSR